MLPELPWYWPDAQVRHDEAPLEGAYCPLLHDRQLVLPELPWYLPDAQPRQSDKYSPSSLIASIPPAFAARQALPTTAWLPGSGFPHEKRAAQGTCLPQHDRPEGTGRGAGSAACAGTRGFAAAKKRRGTEAAFGPADLFGSTVRLLSATFRVPIAVTGNCIRETKQRHGNCIRETKQRQASTTPAEQTTPVGGF